MFLYEISIFGAMIFGRKPLTADDDTTKEPQADPENEPPDQSGDETP